jgi:hypothetical protein
MSDTEARDLATAFLDHFNDETRFLTNTRRFSHGFENEPGFSWEPVTPSTFDLGVVAEGDGVTGILWFQDED